AAAAEQAVAYNNLAAAYYITAQGVPFIHAGEEMLRSKPSVDAENNFVFDHNSYSSGDGVNSFKWGELTNGLKMDSYNYYKGLIAFRKAHPALRMTDQAEILEAMSSWDTGNSDVIAILNEGGNGEDNAILSIFNTSTSDVTVKLPAGRQWYVYVNGNQAGTKVLAIAYDELTVPATSAVIMVEAPLPVIASGWSGYTTWTLDVMGTLTVSPTEESFNGETNMKNYWKVNGVLTLPWGLYADMITKVVVEDGVHDLGQMAFYELPNLTTVVLGESVTEIRNYTFKNCTSLTTINLENVDTICEGAFYGCSALTDVTLGDAVVIGDWAFSKTGVSLN
ncbi:MAG: leucine-rich repeat protein, partial [Oscillospiraceae bacterium]|nr:leucine-rich repeat protein [Oscillospiraceae bacterium]